MSTEPNNRGPRFVAWLNPVLDALRKLGDSGTPDEVVEQIAAALQIPEAEQNALTDTGQLRFKNQVAWARFYLTKAGLIDSSKRGIWRLTEEGKKTHLSAEEAYKLFRHWHKTFQKAKADEDTAASEDRQAELETEVAPNDYRARVLEIMRNLPPAGFERLSQRILRESGFTHVQVTGQSSDGGIDGHGILQMNPLVSFKVIFQCKRYAGNVTPSIVRDFRGAMTGRADKGIIITTGTFTAEARREASRDGAQPIELVDSDKLVNLLEHLELGLKRVMTYEVEESFFAEFES